MNVLDLFSGIGGFSLGLERAGMKTVAFCENGEFQRRVLRKNWPNIPIYNDIKDLDVRKINADVYAGGFPCTQTSIAASIHNKRTGIYGKDSGLWFEYLRVISIGKPSWVIVENPGGVKKWESEIQGGLESIGYTVSRLELKASHFGLPHKRLRYIYVSNRYGERLEIARQTGSPSTEWFKRLAATRGAWLSGTPGIIGSFNGVPNRVDRVRSLGNAIVPQMAELVGLSIMESVADGI